MRISDWSSDVYASDLISRLTRADIGQTPCGITQKVDWAAHFAQRVRQARFVQQHFRTNPWTAPLPAPQQPPSRRSEEHTSELQSLMRISYAVFCLKKKKKTNLKYIT